MIRKEKNGVIWYEFEHMAQTGLIDHCFSTRIGGVSTAPQDTMNLAYHMNDRVEAVEENFRRMGAAIGFDPEKVIRTRQIHENHLQVMTADNDVVADGIDGLVTAKPDLVLTSYYADCVPLLFLDPKKSVIANSHAGWRGTSMNMAATTIQKMVDLGCCSEDILVGIGPCISMEHFEVGKEVALTFEENLPQLSSHMKKKNSEKWHLDLTAMNRQLLNEAGIPVKNIEVANLCTFSDGLHFFSHRRDGTARGNMAAMIVLKSDRYKK